VKANERKKWKQVSLRNHVPVTTIGLQTYTFSQASSLMAKDITIPYVTEHRLRKLNKALDGGQVFSAPGIWLNHGARTIRK
jgi:hypothetical protein